MSPTLTAFNRMSSHFQCLLLWKLKIHKWQNTKIHTHIHTFLTMTAWDAWWKQQMSIMGGGGRGAVKWDGCDPTWLLPLKGWMFKSERGSGLVWMWYIPIPYIKLFFIIYSARSVPPSRRLPPSVHSKKLYGIIKVRKGDDRKKNASGLSAAFLTSIPQG